MAIVRTEHLYEFMARVGIDTSAGRVVGMHVLKVERLTEEGQPTREVVLPPEPVDWDGLVALMHEDDRALLAAALAAAE